MSSSSRCQSWKPRSGPEPATAFCYPAHTTPTGESAIEPPAPHARRHARLLAISVAAALAGLLGLSLYLPAASFFSSDTGVRFLQVRELQAQPGIDFALRYHGRSIDPELRFVPWYYAYSEVDGRLLLHIPPWLPLAGLALEAVAGEGALWLAPMFGSLLAALALALWAARAGLRRPVLLFWAALLASPLFFYSLVFWDHSWAAAWTVVACALLAFCHQGSKSLTAVAVGLALGWCSAQRPECLVMGLALGLAWISLHFRALRVVALVGLGACLSFGACCLVNLAICGHPLGMGVAPHMSDFGARRQIAHVAPAATPPAPSVRAWTRWRVVGQLLFGEERLQPRRWFWLLALAGLACLLAARGRLRPAGLGLGMTLTVAGWGWLVYRAWAAEPVGLLSSVPLLALVFWPVRAQLTPQVLAGRRLVLRGVGLFLVLMLSLWPSFGGSQWSSRYLLPATPLLWWCGWQQLDHWWGRGGRLVRVSACLLLLLGGLLHTGLAFRHLLGQKRQVSLYKQVIGGWSERLVLTDRMFLPSFMAGLAGTDFFYFDNPLQRDELLERLRVAGETQVVVLEQNTGLAPQHVRLARDP